IDIGRTAMPLELDRNDASRLRQSGPELPKVDVDVRERAVDQDQRTALSLRLVVHAQAVDHGVLPNRCLGHFTRLGSHTGDSHHRDYREKSSTNPHGKASLLSAEA